ncbi:MAG: gliding motility-associated C-terminal domain-containing protein [Saprospiraceae bacterium]
MMNYPKELCPILRKKIKKKQVGFSILLLVFFLNPFLTYASHIVGGEMSYNCLGGNTFEVKLTVYRDCFYGAPNAGFDTEASIGIFDANNNLVLSLVEAPGGQLLIPATVDDTLDIILSDPCLFAPEDICVHSMTYIDTIALPPISGGYQLVYQRCCRNSSISNIVSSFDTGASFVIDISETALLECNSSPQFIAMPPVFLCVNEPFEFDQSVIDIDGDSLVYSLCTPFDGASFDDPRPQPPLPPPYDPINWQNPPYSINNLLGGTALEIDPSTGIVTAIPNTQGIFLVGMCIQEYRNGELISETRREFQYNVGICSELEADFEIPAIQCENLEVDFVNTSSNVNEFLWYFNDPGNPNATSFVTNPTYTYSDTGTYTIMLVANPNGICSDTAYATISLTRSSLEPNFSYITLDCTDSVNLALIDQSVDLENDIIGWEWVLSDGQISNEQFPIFTIDSSQLLEVILFVKSSNGCQEVKQYSIQVNLISSNLIPTEHFICEGDTIQLNPNPPGGFPFTYEWSPIEGLSDPNIASPLAFPENDITYTLVINDTVNNCFAELTTEFFVLEDPNLSISVFSTPCEEETTLTASTILNVGEFQWATDENFNNIISDSSSVTVSNFGETIYFVRYSNGGFCEAKESVTVVEESVNVQLINSQFVCVGGLATFSATNLDPNDTLSYTWFNLGVLSTDSVFEITSNQAGSSVFYFQAENQYGCTYLDSVFLVVIDDTAPVEIETVRSCNDNFVQFSNLSPNANYYQWIIELPSGNDTLLGQSINYEFPNNGIFTISLLPISGLPCTLPSEVFEINLAEENVTADFEWSYLQCEDELEIQLVDVSTVIQGTINSWVWTFGNGTNVLDQNPILTLNSNQEIEVQLIVTTDEGCSDTINETITFSLIDVSFFEEEAVICDGNSVVLNPLGNPDYDYEWSPALFLNDVNAVSPVASPPVTSTYTVIISDPNNNDCKVEKTVLVIVPDEPVVANFNYEVINCDGDNITFSFTDSSTPADNINNWFYAFSNGQFSNNPNTIIVAQAGTNLIVQFQVQTVEGCTDIFIDTIEVEPFSFNLPQNEIIKCSGVPVNLNPGGNPNYSYSWSPSSTLNNATIANPIANPIETTEYCVTVTNGTCIEESCVTVLVPDIPLMADFSYNVSDCINEAVIQFFDESQYSFGNVIEWHWTFSNGMTSDLEEPILIVDENITLEVTLEVVTEDGCEASFTNEVEINLLEINIPSQMILCDGNPIQLNLGGNPNHTYSWSPSAGLTNDDVVSPFAYPLSTTTYTVEISDGACEVIQTIEVVVPTVPLTPDFSFLIDDCTDVAVIDFEDQSTFAPGQIVSWNWQFSTGDSADISNPSITFDQSQTLIVNLEVITNNGCIGSTSQSIDINLIDINIQDTIVDCNSDGVSLNPGGNLSYNYAWSPGTGLSNPTAPNPLANPTSTTIYSVTVSDGPCEITRTVEVIVPDEPLEPGFTFVFDDCTDNAVIEFTDTTLNYNNTITNWNWSFTGNNTIISDLQNPVITLNESETIIAELTVTTADGCVASSSQEVEINLIDINVPGSIIYCSTGGIVLNPGGNSDYDYNWAPSNGLSATNIASPTISNLTQTTNYSVTVTNGNCTLTRTVEILVPAIPLQADFEVEYLNCIDSAVLQLNDVSVFSGNIVAWDWLVNSQVSDEQNPIFTFYTGQPVNVQLIVTSAHGCRDTLINEFDISIMDDVFIQSAVASCNGNGVFLNPASNPNYNYHWSPGIGLAGDTLSANPFANPDSSVVYNVTITNGGNGCVEERSVAFNVPTNPLTAGFEWELVICSDSAVVEFTDTSSYSGNISTWEWTVGNAFIDEDQNPIFNFQDADTVEVQLIVTSDDGCIDSITNSVIIDIIEIETIQDTIQLCGLDSVYLNPNGNPNLFYTWSPAVSLDSANYFNPLATPLASTEYFVTITSPNNITCNEVRKVNVLIPTQPIDLNWTYPSDTIICDLSIELIAPSNNAIEYIWSDQSDFQNILGDQSLFTASPNNNVTYYLQVSDDAGCTLSDSIEITSYAILADLEEEVTLCYGDSLQVEVILSPLSPVVDLQFSWSPQDGIVIDNNTATPVFSPFDSTEYSLLIENQFGCEYADTIQVNVFDLEMLVELTSDLDSINAGELVQINTTENSNWEYTWTPCDPTISTCIIANPIVAPEITTTYYLEIEDNINGCIYKDSITIFVFDQSRCEEPYVFVPKGFTPNDDGLNDQLFVRGNYIEEVHFVIFNRWGEKVFETKDLNEGWDGKINGKIVPPDVFGYYVELKCFGGEEFLLKGNVTLIR